MKVGYVLPEPGEPYHFAVFVIFERDARNGAILPGVVILRLYAAGEVDIDFVAR